MTKSCRWTWGVIGLSPSKPDLIRLKIRILGIWRHVYQRFPLRYDPLYWGAVFPLGMYAACTFEMAHAMSLDFLVPIARVFVYVALLAWATTFAGLVQSLVGTLTPALHFARGRRDYP